MSLSLVQWLACLAQAQAEEVAPALMLLGTPDAPDPNYAGGTAATTAMLLMLAVAEAAGLAAREAAATAAARPLVGDAADGRDSRAAALGALLVAAEASGDVARQRAILACLCSEAEAEMTTLGLPLPL